MTTLTASSGTVSLTSATGWSPSQVPAPGDDLVVGAATLNLDADMTGADALGSITFNNASSRLSFSGTNRAVECLNGFLINANITSSLIGTAIPAGSTSTLEGKWTFGSLLVSSGFAIASLNGGTLNLRTIGSVASDVLAETSGNSAFRIISSSSSGTLNTVGRFSFGSAVQHNVINVAGANWNHTSSGLNTIGPTPLSAFSISGSSRISWTGSVDSQSPVASGTFLFSSTDTGSTIGQAGDTFCARGSGSSTNPPTSLLRASGTGAVELAGKWVAKNRAATLDLAGSTVRYRNQSISIASDEHLTAVVAGGTLDMSGLEIANAGKVVIAELAAATVTADAQTLITNQTTAAQAASNSSALSGRIITLESDPPTLPDEEEVAAGTTYGYSEAPLTGTGLIIDPGVLAAAVQAGVGLPSANLDTRLVGITDAIDNIVVDQGAPLSSGGQHGILHKGGTYWFTVECFDDTGLSVALDEAPTIVIVKNGEETLESATATDRDEDGKHYDCSYNPTGEVEGDRFELRITVLIGTVSYSRPSEHFVVVASTGLDDKLNEAITNARLAAQNSF